MGGWPQRAPVGYINVRQRADGREIAKVVPDSKRAFLVKEAFRLYSTGDYSLNELHSLMSGKGLTSPASRKGNPLARSKLADMLGDPFYMGIVEWNGVSYKGQHKPIVSKAVFNKVQEVRRLHNKAGVRERTHDHYLKGLLSCGECGRRLSLTLAKGTYLYFYCLGQKNTLKKQTNCTLSDDLRCRVPSGSPVQTSATSSEVGYAIGSGA
jgi:site-specific DNA recombinase